MPLRAALIIGLLAPFVAADASAGARTGEAVPWFRLTSMTGKQAVSKKTIRGKKVVLVIGRTQKSAPRCKRWILALVKDLPGVKVYQVIVIDKAWFIPRSLVMGKLRKFTPKHFRNDVLLEWYLAFAKQFSIEKDDYPTIIGIDRGGTVRLRHKGELNNARLKQVKALMSQLK